VGLISREVISNFAEDGEDAEDVQATDIVIVITNSSSPATNIFLLLIDFFLA